MSEGPIKREREAWKPTTVSTPDAHRVCKSHHERGTYCGRVSARRRTNDWTEVVCADCVAAANADGIRLPAGVTVG